MAFHKCLRCRSAFKQTTHIRHTLSTCRRQTYSSTTTSTNEPSIPSINQSTQSSKNDSPKPQLDIDELLSKPTWSVRSLLPSTDAENTSPVTPAQLHHLLRLSALPQPTSPAEEETMLRTLATQLHFVRAIQAVDTTGVEPLVTIRDETEEGIREGTIGLQNPAIREALAAERNVGRMGRVRRIRARATDEKEMAVEDRRSGEEREWEPLSGAQGRIVGRHFVVESGRESGSGAAKEAGSSLEMSKKENKAESTVSEKLI